MPVLSFRAWSRVLHGSIHPFFRGALVANPIIVGATLPNQVQLTRFTLTSGNDTPERDPRVWQIQGSNDGQNWTTIYNQNNTSAGLWTARDQVLEFNSADFSSPAPFSSYRMVTTATGLTSGARFQLNEIELFGTTNFTPRIDITTPGDPIQLVNGTNDGDSDAGAPPANEGVANAINNTPAKYLNFLDLGSGLVVTPTVGSTNVTGLRVYTANDAPERDPASYVLEGSTSGPNGLFTLISQGTLVLPTDRNGGSLINFGEINFANSAFYTTYRLTFPTLRDAGAANSMQIGEIELLGTVQAIPEPASAMLGLLSVGALALRRRRAA